MEAITQEVTGEEEEDVADEQENISREPDQDTETGKAPGSIEDLKLNNPHDKKEEEAEESSTDEGTLEGDLRNRKKSRFEAESLRLPAETNLQTPGNGVTFCTPASKLIPLIRVLITYQTDPKWFGNSSLTILCTLK